MRNLSFQQPRSSSHIFVQIPINTGKFFFVLHLWALDFLHHFNDLRVCLVLEYLIKIIFGYLSLFTCIMVLNSLQGRKKTDATALLCRTDQQCLKFIVLVVAPPFLFTWCWQYLSGTLILMQLFCYSDLGRSMLESGFAIPPWQIKCCLKRSNISSTFAIQCKTFKNNI